MGMRAGETEADERGTPSQHWKPERPPGGSGTWDLARSGETPSRLWGRKLERRLLASCRGGRGGWGAEVGTQRWMGGWVLSSQQPKEELPTLPQWEGRGWAPGTVWKGGKESTDQRDHEQVVMRACGHCPALVTVTDTERFIADLPRRHSEPVRTSRNRNTAALSVVGGLRDPQPGAGQGQGGGLRRTLS